MDVLSQNKQNIQKLENYINKYFPSIKKSNFITFVDIVYMTIIRLAICMDKLLEDLEKGILDVNKFRTENYGNIYDFIKSEYVEFAQRIKDITIGSNGGMANVGKGEWLVSFCSGINPKTKEPNVSIIKNGGGDYKYNDTEKCEEMKWNGGKVSTERSGLEVTKIFNNLININDKHWIPFRTTDKPKYSEEEEERYNAVYWNAISGEPTISLSDNELKKNIINMAFQNTFRKCDTFIMFTDDGDFHRFHSFTEANKYYENKYEKLINNKGFECRANQSNPIALYCRVF
jgi:hypothetical protein